MSTDDEPNANASSDLRKKADPAMSGQTTDLRAQPSPDVDGLVCKLEDHRASDRKQVEGALQWSARRNELLSDTAARLLQSRDPQGLVEVLCRQVMEFLDCHAFFNFLVDEHCARLHLNACAGIPDEEARQLEWLDFGVAVCGCAARDRQRIIAEDILDTPDPRTELVKSLGIQAYCCHPLQVQGRLIGTLSFGTRSRPRFRPEEIEVMKAVTDLVAMAMHRIRTEQELRENEDRLRAALDEKEVLLKEIHHRVKNNMQVISSLVALQAQELKDDAVRAVLEDVTHRVRSMALVHEKLYQSPDLARVPFADYARTLLEYLWRSLGTTSNGIRLVLDLQPVSLSINAALPCGLILNELASNAFKARFPWPAVR